MLSFILISTLINAMRRKNVFERTEYQDKAPQHLDATSPQILLTQGQGRSDSLEKLIITSCMEGKGSRGRGRMSMLWAD